MITIDIEMKMLGTDILVGVAEIEVTVDEGTPGSLLGRSVDFANLVSFDYVLEDEDGNAVEMGRDCVKQTHPNTYDLIESYIALNWGKIVEENSTKIFV